MEYRSFAKTNMVVSTVGLGCNGFGSRIYRDDAESIIKKAMDLGVNFFDTADIYGNQGSAETILGDTLRSGRESFFIATKFGGAKNVDKVPGQMAIFIRNSIELSLRRLRSDYIDLYQLHYPENEDDMEQVFRTLDILKQDGKVRYIGCCNAPASLLQKFDLLAEEYGCERFIAAQLECNALRASLLKQECDAAIRVGRSLIPFLPLAGGVLTGKYRGGRVPLPNTRLGNSSTISARYLSRDKRAITDRLFDYANQRGMDLVALSVGLLLAEEPISTVIAGASNQEQLAHNVTASQRWKLTTIERAEIYAICTAGDVGY